MQSEGNLLVLPTILEKEIEERGFGCICKYLCMYHLQVWSWPSSPEAWHPSSSSQSVVLLSSVSPLPSSSQASIWPSFGNLSWVSWTTNTVIQGLSHTGFMNINFTMFTSKRDSHPATIPVFKTSSVIIYKLNLYSGNWNAYVKYISVQSYRPFNQ